MQTNHRLRFLYSGAYFATAADSYADYGAWSEAMTGAGGLPSGESIEHFIDLLAASGIEVIPRGFRHPSFRLRALAGKYSGHAEAMPLGDLQSFDGLILTRFSCAGDLERILAAVRDGLTLLALRFRNPLVPSFYVEGEKDFTPLLDTLDVAPDGIGSSPFTLNHGSGRIVLIDGTGLTDWALDSWMDQEDKSGDAIRAAERLCASLASFPEPRLTARASGALPPVWATGAQLLLSVEIKNWGPELDHARCEIDLPEGVEPLSPVRIRIGTLRRGETALAQFHVKAADAGAYPDHINVGLEWTRDGRTVSRTFPTPFPETFLSPFDVVSNQAERREEPQIRQRIDDLPQQDENQLRQILETARIDPQASVIRARNVLEQLVERLLQDRVRKRLRPAGTAQLGEKIAALRNARVIDKIVFSWMNTVRELGNLAAHSGPAPAPIKERDALVILDILVSIIDELLKPKLL